MNEQALFWSACMPVYVFYVVVYLLCGLCILGKGHTTPQLQLGWEAGSITMKCGRGLKGRALMWFTMEEGDLGEKVTPTNTHTHTHAHHTHAHHTQRGSTNTQLKTRRSDKLTRFSIVRWNEIRFQTETGHNGVILSCGQSSESIRGYYGNIPHVLTALSSLPLLLSPITRPAALSVCTCNHKHVQKMCTLLLQCLSYMTAYTRS